MILRLHDVWKTYQESGGRERHALHGVSLSVASGTSVAVTGRSGSGKSTLLHLAAGIDEPTRGSVFLLDRELSRLSDRERTLERRNRVGLVFQFFHLLPHLSVIENVGLPGRIAGDPDRVWMPRAKALLARVGLDDRATDAVGQLSGGEMQRVALCRALLRRPALLLADEPTGNLDDENGRLVMDLLLSLARDEGAALVYVTHSADLAAMADERRHLVSGEWE